MKRHISLCDIDISKVLSKKYDLAFFSSGYEKRSTSVIEKLSINTMKRICILYFNEHSADEQRLKNDKYFSGIIKDQIKISSEEDSQIFEYLNSLAFDEYPIRILIDYSSMSRLWYAGILNWLKYNEKLGDVFVDMVYAVGEHKSNVAPMVINSILSIPGCEGGSIPLNQSVAIMGLGFDNLASECVLELLEPDRIYTYYASPAAFPEYPSLTTSLNSEIINLSKKTVPLPLNSIQTTFNYIAELIKPYINKSDIFLIPMGPKPHVLASILLSMKFEEVNCLRVSGKKNIIERINATEEYVCSEIKIWQINNNS